MNAPASTGALLDARYQLGAVIARGGMSTVYRGVDTRLDRPVAVKVMDPRLAGDPAFRTRFEREARSAARIDHPAVVDVFDQGDDMSADGPVLFLVMELVEGGTLRDVLRARGALGVPAAVAVMEQVLSGLAQAHRLGLVHRDVKPENVLISDAREVKVADFGLVVAAAQAGASHVGMIMGTVAYLSPEQVATGAADPRSDVYAAGVLFYELLTGAPPYTGDTAISVAFRHVNSDVPAPSLIAGDVPPELDDLVLRATRRDPSVRPVDAAAMLADLRHVARQLEMPRVLPPAPPARAAAEPDTVPTHGAHGTRFSPRDGRATGPDGSGHVVADGGPRGTQALPRPTGSHRGDSPAAPPHLRERRRSRRVFGIWIAVVVIVALALGLSVWWITTGRWAAVPTLVGLERVAAEDALRAAGLVPAATVEVDDTVDEGVVSAAARAPAEQLLRGSTVEITVSDGPPAVPAIGAGTEVADAELALRDAKLQPEQDDAAVEFSDSVPEGTVIRTDPEAGTELSIDDPVTLVLSRGVEPEPEEEPVRDGGRVRVPFLIGERFDEAQEILAGLGLEAEEQSAPLFGRDNGRVVGQSRGAGSLVEPDTTIVLDTL